MMSSMFMSVIGKRDAYTERHQEEQHHTFRHFDRHSLFHSLTSSLIISLSLTHSLDPDWIANSFFLSRSFDTIEIQLKKNQDKKKSSASF